MRDLTISQIGKFKDGRLIYRVPRYTPAHGYIAFGVIDRGTNVVQARPTTICPQNCIFCSVDAGLRSKNRWAEFITEPELVIKGVRQAVEVKDCSIEVLLDTIGDVLTYSNLIDLVRDLKKTNGVKSVALETHGLLLSRKLIDKLAEAGLDRVNLSIETLNPEKAKYLYGTPIYDVKRIIEVVEYTVKETTIDVHVTPLWLPNINDRDIVDVINWALRIGAGKKWPPVTVQKFIKHKYGRGKHLKSVSWSEFWNFIEKLERVLGIRLRWSMSEWNMHYTKRIPSRLSRGDIVEVKILSRGWLRGEYLGLYKDVLVAVTPIKGIKVNLGSLYLVEVVNAKDGLYIAKILKYP